MTYSPGSNHTISRGAQVLRHTVLASWAWDCSTVIQATWGLRQAVFKDSLDKLVRPISKWNIQRGLATQIREYFSPHYPLSSVKRNQRNKPGNLSRFPETEQPGGRAEAELVLECECTEAVESKAKELTVNSWKSEWELFKMGLNISEWKVKKIRGLLKLNLT